MKILLVTDATQEPVTLAEAKLHSRIEVDTDDALISSYIKAARTLCEQITRRSFINTTWKYVLDTFPNCKEIVLPRTPLNSITHVKYYAWDGTLTTLDSSYYYEDFISEPGRIYLKPSKVWPQTETDRINSVEITYVSGYGDQTSLVPDNIKTAIKQIVAHWYNIREAVAMQYSVAMEVPMSAQMLLAPYRVMRFF